MVFERMQITLPKDARVKLDKIAQKERRSLSNMIVHLIDQYPDE